MVGRQGFEPNNYDSYAASSDQISPSPSAPPQQSHPEPTHLGRWLRAKHESLYELQLVAGSNKTGAHDADRTRDLVLTKDVLYQLSYMGLDFVKQET